MRREFAQLVAISFEERGATAALVTTFAVTWDLITTAFVEYVYMLVRDLRYALRSLRRTPLFTAVIVATLAIAIGANAAVFSILDAVVLAPLPYTHPDRLVAIHWYDGASGSVPGSLPDYADVIRGSDGAFAESAAFSFSQMTLTGNGAPRYVVVTIATSDLFGMLGVQPELGTLPTQAQIRPGVAPPVVLADAFWHEAFGADPRVVGRLVRLDGTAYHIAAVAPPTFRQPDIDRGFVPSQVWRFVPDNGLGTPYDRADHQFGVIARLAPGASLASAGAAADRVVDELRRSHQDEDRELGARVVTLADSLVGGQRALFFGIFAAVVAVLLVACANVANLLLSRAASREREISVRTAIGASRGRIVMQLLVEAFVLAAVGGALGVVLAEGLVAAFVALHPTSIPRAGDVAIGVPTLLFTFGVVLVTTVVAGLAPALTASRLNIAIALKSTGRGGDAHRSARARDAFVASEIAITLAIVVAAGLVLRSFVALTSQPLGFDATDVAALTRIDLPKARYNTDAAIDAFEQRGLAAVRAVPGVRDATWSSDIPFAGSSSSTSTRVVGRSYPPGTEPNVNFEIVSATYFSVLRASVRSGNGFTNDDRIGSRPVTLVNESFVRRFFPAGNAIGAQIVPEYSTTGAVNTTKRTIVGIVADIRNTYTKPVEPTTYLPIRQFPVSYAVLLFGRTPGTHPETAAARAIEALDPSLPAPKVVDVSQFLGRDVASQRLSLVALGGLALVALVLAGAGIFAVVSFGVTQRTHEFGIRMALGASGTSVLVSVVLRALRLAFVGIAIGLVVSAISTRFLAGELFETSPVDPMTLAVVTVLVVAIALLAALIPGLRATRVDPIVALRYE